MTIYIIRPEFTIFQGGNFFVGGDRVDLSTEEFESHKHKLEGVETTVLPIVFGSGNENNDCVSYPAPFVSEISETEITKSRTQTLSVFGSFFTPDLVVTTEGAEINSVEFISSQEITIILTAGDNPGDYDLIFDNGSQTIKAISIIDVFSEIVDLRLGGTEFTNSAIEMRDGMTFYRTVDGMVFSGEKPWKSWARFVGDGDRWTWNRSEKRTLSWIYQNSNFFMLGIGSRANDPESNAQYYQGEILSFSNDDKVNLLYGNTGQPGDGTTQFFSVNKNAIDIIKITLTQNGDNGTIFRVYRLIDGNINNWFDTSTLLKQITITGFGSDEPEIMPFVIPQDNDTTKLLGFILEENTNV